MEVLKRLLYKEWRESWVVVGVFLTAPAFLALLARYATWPNEWGSTYEGYVVVPSAMLVYLWAATKAPGGQSRQSELLGALPIRPFVGWLAITFPSPLLVWGLAYWFFHFAHQQQAFRYIEPLGGSAWLAASYFAALVVGRATSRWVGPIAGVVTALYAQANSDTVAASLRSSAKLAGLVLVLSVLGLLLRKKRAQVRYKVAVAYAIALPIVLFGTLLTSQKQYKPSPVIVVIDDVCVVRRSWEAAPKGMVRYWATIGSDPKLVLATSSRVAERDFPYLTTPLTAHGDFLYLLEPSEILNHNARIVEWNIPSNTTRPICNLPTTFKTISDALGFSSYDLDVIGELSTDASVDPKGNRMLVRLPSARTTGFDVWLVNTVTGRRKLCVGMPGTARSVAWRPDSAILAGSAGVYRLDTTTGGIARLYPREDRM